MAIARIAWQRIVENGRQSSVIGVLQHHPHRAVFLEAGRPERIDADEWLFVHAATWADWVGGPGGRGVSDEEAAAIVRKYHHPDWHFVNIPFVHPDDTGRFDGATIRDDVLEPAYNAEGIPRHALAALELNFRLLRSESAPDEDRAAALCWVLHLIGDMHQPLHCAALIGSKSTIGTEEFLPPHGDQGGNRLAVRVEATSSNALTLHAFWDGLWFSEQPYPQVRDRTLSWINDPALQRATFGAELKQSTPREWAEESWTLAKSAAYRHGDAMLEARPLPARHAPEDLIELNAPSLPAGYAKNAEAAARRQIVLAGYRLADRLEQVWRAQHRD